MLSQRVVVREEDEFSNDDEWAEVDKYRQLTYDRDQ